jgi:hypothetical protein
MEEAFEEGQGPHRAVEPVMMILKWSMNGASSRIFILLIQTFLLDICSWR